MVELFVLVVGMAVGIKLIANSAEARGRSQMLWGLAAGVVYLAGYFLVGLVFERLDVDTEALGWVLLAAFSPYLLAALAVGAVGLLIRRLGIKVVQRREYDVHCRHNGAGRLEITPEIVRLHWEGGRSQEVARSELQTVAVDGECLRLCWAESELLLLPMMRPQTREGRISQSQALARILSPGLPVAIRVDRNAKSAG